MARELLVKGERTHYWVRKVRGLVTRLTRVEFGEFGEFGEYIEGGCMVSKKPPKNQI